MPVASRQTSSHTPSFESKYSFGVVSGRAYIFSPVLPKFSLSSRRLDNFRGWSTEGLSTVTCELRVSEGGSKRGAERRLSWLHTAIRSTYRQEGACVAPWQHLRAVGRRDRRGAVSSDPAAPWSLRSDRQTDGGAWSEQLGGRLGWADAASLGVGGGTKLPVA